jgi:hypothetical protein
MHFAWWYHQWRDGINARMRGGVHSKGAAT